MKLSFVSLSWLAQLSLYARPTIVEHEIDDVANTTEWSGDCWKQPAKRDAETRCHQPNQELKAFLACHKCSFWGRDTHNWCPIQCCDKSAEKPHQRCACTHYKRKYDKNGWPAGTVGADTAEKCCAVDKDGNPKTLAGGLCGCSDVGTHFKYGGYDSDCCSGTKDGNSDKCIAGKCAKKGEKGKCCRIFSNDADRVEKDSCPCFHGGEAPNPNDDVSWENCCTGKKNDAGNACGCIKDSQTDLPKGGDKRDCCSGALSDDKKFCKAAKCSNVGVTAKKGDHCCSGSKNDDKVCLCLASGKDVPSGGTFQDCCSGRIKDGKCDFLLTGEAILNGTNPKDVCLSKGADENGRCRCIEFGAASTNASQCCSEKALDGKCSCAPLGHALGHGGGRTNCCSKASVNGVCRCAAPGAPLKPEHCCAKSTGADGFCGCMTNETGSVSPEQRDHCCGGSYNYDGSTCKCVESGYAVGHWAPDAACCSKKKKDGVCEA